MPLAFAVPALEEIKRFNLPRGKGKEKVVGGRRELAGGWAAKQRGEEKKGTDVPVRPEMKANENDLAGGNPALGLVSARLHSLTDSIRQVV